MVVTEITAIQKNFHMCKLNNSFASSNKHEEGIFIKNMQESETLNYSLVLLHGQAPMSCSHIKAQTANKNKISEWPIVNGEFRIVMELQRGINKFELEAGSYKRKLSLKYEPRSTRLRVTPIYIICAGHDGYFQGPYRENRSPESAATRIGLGARLLQTLTAEKLCEAGHGRKTFQLERDLDGPDCLVMHSELHVDRAREMSQRELWELMGRELMTSPLASKDRKYMAFLSCTKYRGARSPRTHEDILARTQAHAALGGGGLALFGSACLHTWPTSVSQIQCRFLDTTMIDTEQLMDDSNYRGTHGGCLATTLGSVLHELGHTFDLGHTQDGIMGRGFDYIDRVFIGAMNININQYVATQREPQHITVDLCRSLNITVTIQQPPKTNIKCNKFLPEISKLSPIVFYQSNLSILSQLPAPINPELNRLHIKSIDNNKETISQTDITYWGNSCAALLAYHRWFNAELDVRNHNYSELKYDNKRNVVKSCFGIRVIELRELKDNMVIASRQFLGDNLIIEAAVPSAPPYCKTSLILFAEDSIGRILKCPHSAF